MRLYYIDKPKCYHIMDITKRVQKIYQLEAELEPYLIVDFWPNRNEEPASITLYVGDNCVIDKMIIDLDKKEDFEKLRDILWVYIRKVHNPYDLTDEKGCLKNMMILQKNNVIQGWQAKLRDSKINGSCYISKNNHVPTGIVEIPPVNEMDTTNQMSFDIHSKNIRNIIAKQYEQYMRYRMGTETMEDKVKHWSYRDPVIYPKPDIDIKKCKEIRYLDCNDNFPVNTPVWQRCIDESKWLCDKWYSGNNNVTLTDKLVDQTRKEIYDYLDKNDLRVDKKMFDDIITAGLFNDLGNRMGNKSSNITNSVDQYMTDKGYYLKLVEGFNDSDNKNKNNWNYVYVILCIILIVMCMYFI